MRPASVEEAAVASDILSEAARWLMERGETLWHLEELTPELLRPVARQGELFLAYWQGQAVGTLIYQHADPLFWPEVPAGTSAFVHKVAVRRAVAGQGVAAAMLAWAQERARAEGLAFLRLDTDFNRPKLRSFYEGLGFVCVGEKRVTRMGYALHVALYELRL
ncbi:MAG: GNAT family N-acetyltransferase [Meiothermus ruber]|jgi:GNAT superfamily N-acetyltransferase|uniref:GNAT family N-acetyltransferase n=1 Tax=Meiothermus TaxID=65551 RepID=UPI0021DDFB12|nr:GNAT family N-acetyltransferase [Meiothermus sp.]GIW27110.1 MAG: GNAT family N-acetyltransferase [Meiothermus sp.]